MPASPKIDGSTSIKLVIKIDGRTMDDTYKIVSVHVEKSVNKVPWARIELSDGDMAEGKFPISDTNDFKPGTSVTIQAGYGRKADTIFEGLVIRHSIKVFGNNQSRLMVECRDPTVRMTVGRKNTNFIQKKDSDILKDLITNYPNLSANVTATSIEYEELVQYYCTDWDFMLSRAEVNGQIVIVDDGKITIAPPNATASPKLTVTYGHDLLELEADMDARSQFASVKGTAWDLQTQDVVEVKSKPKKLNKQGNLSSRDLARVIGLDDFRLQTPIPLDQEGLKAWTDAQQIKSGLARIRGRMKFQGNAKVIPGDLVDLAGTSKRFNGPVFVAAVSHTIARGDWISTIRFGLAPDWFVEAKTVEAPAASGLLPGVDGLQIGVVSQIHEDPHGQYRVKVTVPVMQAQSQGIWARLAGFYASEEFGAFFYPEIGDEVVLGYFNNDPSHPVILGSLYSSKRKPLEPPDDGNNIKALITRSQLTIAFDDEKKIITVATPGGNQIELSDDGESISLQDQNENKVTLDADGISLDSPKDITIKAHGKIILDATDKIDMTSKSDVKLSGMNVDHNAKASFTAKGNSSAEVSASGQTTVKGGMVMIN